MNPFDDISSIRARFLDGSPSLVALDFDGTLTEIVDDPSAPAIQPLRHALLTRIAAPGRRLAIVSGRSIDDVLHRVQLRDAILVGNHGMEIEGPEIHERPDPALAETLAVLLAQSQRVLAGLAQTAPEPSYPLPPTRAWIENKRWTASVHTRPRDDRRFHAEVGRRLDTLIRPAEFALRPGKATWEIRPAAARNKGAAIRAILDSIGADEERTLYIGDDATDEDAFCALPNGVTIRVGAGDTIARYRVSDPAAVYDFLGAAFLT